MPSLADLARTHQDRRRGLTDRTTSTVLRLWRSMSVNDLEGSWLRVGETITSRVADAQVRSASMTVPYMRAVDGATVPVPPESFTGITLEGRELAPELFGAVTATKKLIGAGRPAQEAFTVGAAFLAMVTRNAVQDMGRQADLVGGVAVDRTQYIRVIRPGACSRCAILAGARSSAKPYLRHPSCQCAALPMRAGEEIPEGLYGSPLDYFNSLTGAEQRNVFTNAGAKAIRNGADPIKVVNARRGAYGIGYSGHYGTFLSESKMRRMQPTTIGVRPDGTPLQAFSTTESTTRRGVYGRTSQAVRLMPEQIAVMAGGDQARWVELLRKYGYLY